MTEKAKIGLAYKVFRATGETPWDKLFTAAAEFAATVGAENVVNISHSSDEGSGTVVVWYRKETND